ncbi:MAG: hypothetical protein WCP97_07655 [bacterium]
MTNENNTKFSPSSSAIDRASSPSPQHPTSKKQNGENLHEDGGIGAPLTVLHAEPPKASDICSSSTPERIQIGAEAFTEIIEMENQKNPKLAALKIKKITR